jgi:hypothetical protein
LGAFGNFEKLNYSDSAKHEKPKGDKQPDRRIVVLAQFL